MQREELNRYLDGLLEVSRFRDYCPNGLQVEGRREIRRIVSGVTASLDLIQAALTDGADAILVHHGYFWKGDDPCLTGTRRARIGLLVAHEGHHATEKYGVQALGEHLAARFGMEHRFIDIPNPV